MRAEVLGATDWQSSEPVDFFDMVREIAPERVFIAETALYQPPQETGRGLFREGGDIVLQKSTR